MSNKRKVYLRKVKKAREFAEHLNKPGYSHDVKFDKLFVGIDELNRLIDLYELAIKELSEE